MEITTAAALAEIAAQIGAGVSDLGFAIELDGGATRLDLATFDLTAHCQPDGAFAFEGHCGGVGIFWTFVPQNDGYCVQLALDQADGLACERMSSLLLTYRPPEGTWRDCRVPTLALGVHGVGMHPVDQLTPERAAGSMLRGAFANGRDPGLFVGTHLPQRNLHLYTLRSEPEVIRFECTTHYPEGLSRARRLLSETTWVCARRSLREAIEAYAAHLPRLGPATPPVGWNSWDYYFFSVSLADVIENMEAIRADPALSRAVRTVIVDEGWEHLNGEWFPNYRFPGGLEHLAHEIARHGFVPGVWTSPVMVDTTSKTALRDYQMLVRDQYGDPQVVYGHYLVDPTHPQGAAFLRELYTRLYRAGFRFFKVDYVDALLQAGRFHDPTKGPYEVLRDLFALIRACVTGESHILGCSLPQECGPGCADSLRSGIDIHNQWTHIEWAADYMQLGYWWHERIALTDPDFLIARGRDTSPEAETNVLNPKAHHPNPPRWRRGPVFTLDEARTWATLVCMSGGSVFLSDRLSALNDAGHSVIAEVLHPTGTAARPLDLGEGERASLWFAHGDACHLAVINWTDQPQTQAIDLAAWGIAALDTLREVWSGKILPVQDGRLTVSLAPHASALFHWG